MGTPPYENLYVYEVEGEVFGSRDFLKEDFVGCWNEAGGAFLFFSSPHDEEVELFLKSRGRRLLSRHLMDYRSWQAGEELKPFRVGNLLFCPPWENVAPEEGTIVVWLDPSVVFGTGTHPTTRGCLEALWQIYQKERPERVLDLGTGSGILALAAAKWGAQRILAIDCNELAVDTARRNVILNKEEARIEVSPGRAEDFVEFPSDLVCANLHRSVIESLMAEEAFCERRWIVLSGLFIREARAIEAFLQGKGIETFLKIEENPWATWVGFNERIGWISI
jgi:ribosomal protein L11 methyltransferase